MTHDTSLLDQHILYFLPVAGMHELLNLIFRQPLEVFDIVVGGEAGISLAGHDASFHEEGLLYFRVRVLLLLDGGFGFRL